MIPPNGLSKPSKDENVKSFWIYYPAQVNFDLRDGEDCAE
jgi:hypothetical protein